MGAIISFFQGECKQETECDEIAIDILEVSKGSIIIDRKIYKIRDLWELNHKLSEEDKIARLQMEYCNFVYFENSKENYKKNHMFITNDTLDLNFTDIAYLSDYRCILDYASEEIIEEVVKLYRAIPGNGSYTLEYEMLLL